MTYLRKRSNKKVITAFRQTPEERAELMKYCKKEELTISEFLRDCIRSKVDSSIIETDFV